MLRIGSQKNEKIINCQYRILQCQAFKDIYGGYEVCEDINSLQKFFLKSFKKYYSETIFKKQLETLLFYFQEQTKAYYHQIHISKTLKHRNVTKCYRNSEDSDCYYLFFQYSNKGTLRELLESNYLFSCREIISLFSQLIEGLIHMHRNNVLHLDINPENVMVECYDEDSNKVFKLTNFAKSRFRKSYIQNDIQYQDSEEYTPSNGDVRYLAPQILKNKQLAECSSDVWSLGITFYEIVYKKRPQQILKSMQQKNPNFKSSIYRTSIYFPTETEIPYGIISLIEDMLKYNLSERISLQQAQFFMKKLIFQYRN